jgi:cytochrome c-type biogenesis protein CcmH
MILWFVLTVMTSIAAVFVSAPFIRRLDRRQGGSSSDIAVYGDQLKEVDKEAELGLIDAQQAETARTEIKRRMLAAANLDDSQLPALSSGERSFAAIGVAGIVVFGSVGLFALTANLEPAANPLPTSPRPLAENPPEKSAPKMMQPSNVAPSSAVGLAASSSKPSQSQLPPVEEMIQRLVTRLQRNPKDIEGWRVLGWSYFSTDHFAEAAAAYARAIELDPDSADYRDARTDALIHAASGVVTQEAKSATEDTLKLHPKDPRARYFKGLALHQGGEEDGARKEWNELLTELDAGDPVARELKQRIEEVEKPALAANAPATTSEPKGPAGAATPENTEQKTDEATSSRGPQPEDVRNAQMMAPSDRLAMIHRMVDSLASRLEQSPNDVDGWIKLIRSWTVLGDKDKAKQAFDKALKAFAEDTPERKRIISASEEFGLNR